MSPLSKESPYCGVLCRDGTLINYTELYGFYGSSRLGTVIVSNTCFSPPTVATPNTSVALIPNQPALGGGWWETGLGWGGGRGGGCCVRAYIIIGAPIPVGVRVDECVTWDSRRKDGLI